MSPVQVCRKKSEKGAEMKFVMKILICFMLEGVLWSATTYTEGESTSFEKINSTETQNIIGNTIVVGNTIECVTEEQYATKNDYDNNYQSFDCSNDLNKNDNNYITRYIDIDTDPNTFNSSSATIHLPSNFKEIVWVGLFWQGHINNYSYVYSDYYNNYLSNDYKDNDIKKTDANKIKVKIGNNSYSDKEALKIYYLPDSRRSRRNIYYGAVYAAYTDITSEFTNKNFSPDQNVTITVANITTTEGWENPFFFRSLGNYGAWSIALIYKEDTADPSSELRHNAVYYGFKVISDGNPDSISLPNLLLPKSGEVKSSMAVFAAEGEYVYSPDTMSLNDTPLGTTGESSCTTDSNAPSCSTNIFDAKLSPSIQREPFLTNNNGIDIDTFDTTEIMTDVRGAPSNTLKSYSVTIELTSGQDAYFPSMVAFTTQLYMPKFCYDYTYGQGGHYQNAPSIKPAIIEGNFDTSQDLNVKLYFKNQEGSDAAVNNLTVDVVDINISLATYKRNSTYITPPGGAAQESVTDGDVGDNHIAGIPIGTVDSYDYFYVYYSLENILQGDFSMPLNANLTYDYTIQLDSGSLTLDHIQTTLAKMEPCTTSNSAYNPVPGKYNIVHTLFQKDSNDINNGFYFNLPTQIVGKYTNDYLIESMDPATHFNTTKPSMAAVQVELIDVSGFHYSPATCTDVNTTVLGKKLWVIMDNNNTAFKVINGNELKSSGFFERASQNAAFRLSYNKNANMSKIVHLNPIEDPAGSGEVRYHFDNFSDFGGDKCVVDMDGNSNNQDMVSDYCYNSGQPSFASAMDIEALSSCLKCVYGENTTSECSRDNFAISPEAFHIVMQDTNTSSGVVLIPEGTTIQNIAAGYPYKIDINATSYNSANAASGYMQSFSDSDGDADKRFAFVWDSTLTDTVCNDTSDHNKSISFSNGIASNTKSIDEVGRYRLIVRDRVWNAVDANPALYTHHGDTTLFKPGADCIPDPQSSFYVSGLSASVSGLNKCTISSTYNSTYYDYYLDVHPYKFDLSTIASSTGLNNANATTNNFVYNANIADANGSGVYTDLNMSYHIYGNIEARGQNDSTLTNFVTGCYAKDISVTLPRSAYADGTMTFKQSLETLDQNGSRVGINFEDANNSKFLVFVPKESFVKQLNGKADVRIRYNFARDISQARNPQKITFNTLSVDCNNMAECQSIANSSTTFQPTSTKAINNTIYFYYARVHAPKMVTNGPDGNATGYYEVYCYGSGCNKNYLQAELAGGTSSISDDPRWWINGKHDVHTYGNITEVKQRRSPADVNAILSASVDNNSTNIALHYNASKGYPYRAIMKIKPNKWLIYNKYNPNADHNEFEAQFNNDTSAWIGTGETQDATETKKFGYKDRKLTW